MKHVVTSGNLSISIKKFFQCPSEVRGTIRTHNTALHRMTPVEVNNKPTGHRNLQMDTAVARQPALQLQTIESGENGGGVVH